MNYKFVIPAFVFALSTFAPALASTSDSDSEDGYKVATTPAKDKEELDSFIEELEPTTESSCFSRLGEYKPTLKQTLFAGGVVAYTAYQHYAAPEHGIMSTLSGVGSHFYTLLGGSFLAANLFSDSIKKYGYEKWILYAPTPLLSPVVAEIQEIIRRAEAKKPLWPQALQKAYEIVYYDNLDFHPNSIKKLDYFSRLPTSAKKFDYKDVCEKAELHLRTYDHDTRKAILDFLAEVCIASYSDLPLKRKSIFFLGDAGVGKTRMASLIAEILGVHLHVINLSTTKNIGFSDNNQPEPMLEAFTPKKQENNYFSNVILFDEIDKVLCPANDKTNLDPYDIQRTKGFLYKLEDEGTLTFESNYLYYNVINIDISQAILIYGGNKIPADVSFLTRLPVIRFNAITPELKSIIATERFEEYLGYLPYKGAITDEHKSVIAGIVKADDKFAGVRALKKVVESYAHHVVKVTTLGHLDQEFDITCQYEKFLTIEEVDEVKKKEEPKVVPIEDTNSTESKAAEGVAHSDKKKRFPWSKKKT